jgi:hypothetical protein
MIISHTSLSKTMYLPYPYRLFFFPWKTVYRNIRTELRVNRDKVKNILRKKRKKVESPLRVKRDKVESVMESAMYGKQGNGEKKKLPLFRWFLRIRGQKQGKEG